MNFYLHTIFTCAFGSFRFRTQQIHHYKNMFPEAVILAASDYEPEPILADDLQWIQGLELWGQQLLWLYDNVPENLTEFSVRREEYQNLVKSEYAEIIIELASESEPNPTDATIPECEWETQCKVWRSKLKDLAFGVPTGLMIEAEIVHDNVAEYPFFIQKRRGFLNSVKSHYAPGIIERAYNFQPNPLDETISKRTWESQVAVWRNKLKEFDNSSPKLLPKHF